MQQSQAHPYQTYFDAALAKALSRYEERVGGVFPLPAKITCVDGGAFWAYARSQSGRVMLDVSVGALDRITNVWHTALHLSESLPTHQQIDLLGYKDHAVETSFSWLLQHELNHHAIGHFDLIDGAGLSEGKSPNGLGIVQRVSKKHSKLDSFSDKELAELHLCLEMQTDHDATEIVLGAYASENWPLFRYYATCVLVVMFIIEAEERLSNKPLRYHPYAATRLFQLVGHLVELPMIPGIKRAHAEGLEHLPSDYLPSTDEIVAYRAEVVKPVIAASQIIAEACGIPEAWSDIGTVEALFADIDTIVVHQDHDKEAFRTQGAKQWAELKPLNAKYLKELGW